MKKFIVFCVALLMIGIGATQMTNIADATFSKDEVVRKRFALKKERLAEIVTKKLAHVEKSIKTKLKEQEVNKVKKQKEETDKKVTEERQEAVQESEKGQDATQNQTLEQTPVEETPTNEERSEAVSGASANGRERGEKNREWGEQLRDPNLTQEERQGIIQEKKNYNRNNHR